MNRGFVAAACALAVVAGANEARADFHGDTYVEYAHETGAYYRSQSFQSIVYGTGANFIADAADAVINIGSLVADFFTGGESSRAVTIAKKSMAAAAWAKNCYGGVNGDAHAAAHCLAKYELYVEGIPGYEQALTAYDAVTALTRIWGDLGDHHEERNWVVVVPAAPALPEIVDVTFDAYYTRDNDLLHMWSPVGWVKGEPPLYRQDRDDHPALQLFDPGYRNSVNGGWDEGTVSVRLRPRLLPFGDYPIFFSTKETDCHTCNSISHTMTIRLVRNPCAESGLIQASDGSCQACSSLSIVNPYTNECDECPRGGVPDASDPRRGGCVPCDAGTVAGRSGTCEACPDGTEPSYNQAACVPTVCFPQTIGQSGAPIPRGGGIGQCQCVGETGQGSAWQCDSCGPAQRLASGFCQDCPPGQIGVPYPAEWELFTTDTQCVADPKLHAPAGYLEAGDGCASSIRGWAWDDDLPGGPVTVEVYDGPRVDGSGNLQVPIATLSSSGRPSAFGPVVAGDGVLAAAGFEYAIPPELRGGWHELHFYALDDRYSTWTIELGARATWCAWDQPLPGIM